MHLDSFEDDINPGITLMRGLAYYQEGTVLSLEMKGPGHYSAFVSGSQIYQVSVVLDDRREIDEIECTCPYDWGDHCKHQVAVLYALRHKLATKEHKMVERPGSVDLSSLLAEISKEALVTFLEEYAKKDPAVVSDLVLAFPSSEDGVNLTNLGIEFRRACDQGIERISYESDYAWEDNEGEDYWQFSPTFKKKIEENLQIIRDAFMAGRIRYAGSIASMMVHELSFLDCTIERVGDDVESAVSKIVALFDKGVFSTEDQSWLFALFFAEAEKYEIGPQAIVLRLCIYLAGGKEDQEVLESYLVGLASGETESEFGFNSTIMHSIELRHSLLLEQQRVKEAQAFALENLQYDSMRKGAYDYAMEVKDYALAEKLASGKAGTERRLYGDENWGELLFKVYQESGNIGEVRSLAKAFLLQDNLRYYPILKASYQEEEEWEAVIGGLLDELEACNGRIRGYKTETYPYVLRAEARLERLVSYLQKYPAWVQDYQDVLLPQYRDEVFALYKQKILSEGERVSNRDGYKDLASWFAALIRLDGTPVAQECLLALEPRYRNRPAMKDELRKVGLL